MKLKKTLLFTLFASALLATVPVARAQSGTFTTLHNFTFFDGGDPSGPLIQGSDGNLYGTTYTGGANSLGTVFQITTAGAITTLHSFSANDGTNPTEGLVQAPDGNFYGTTSTGGANNLGTVYQLTPSGTLTVLHAFAGNDGSAPEARVIVGRDGDLYGTTFNGGASNFGTVFKITTAGAFTLLHSFDDSLSVEGNGPSAALFQASNGNFYGTTTRGGSGGQGTIFQIAADGTFTVLHTFTGTEGSAAGGALIEGATGVLYGTTAQGGTSGLGTIFRFSISSGSLITLHDFGGSDGELPAAGLVVGTDGNFYGVATAGGGSSGFDTGGSLFKLAPDGSIFFGLHNFVDADGTLPRSALLQAADGNFYGTATAGGTSGYGTIYRYSLTATAGTVQLKTPTASVTETSGSVDLTLSRTGGSSGAVSVTVSTVDGTAVAGTDYTGTTSTVSWANGDLADKTFTVPILNPGLNDGSTKSFTVNVSTPTGGVVLGSPVVATVNILDSFTAPQPTVDITSPPANITVVTGASVTLSASVTDPGGIAKRVRFFLNGVLIDQTSGTGPFTLTAPAPAPGTYTIQAAVTDSQGRTNTSTRTITVVAPSATDPVPIADFVSDLDGRALPGGTNVVLVATAQSLSPDGTPLARVDFYADNTLIASFDGSGNPLTSGTHAGRRTAADTSGVAPIQGSVFTAVWGIPNLDKLVNLITVATTQSGISQISSPVTVRAVPITASSNKPPVAKLESVTPGQSVPVGTTITVPVTVSDPDPVPAALGAHRRLSAFGDPSGVISQVEFYLNKSKIQTSTQPPFTVDVTPPAAGKYVIEAIVTDGSGLTGVADPVIINAVQTPTVSFKVPGAAEGSNKTQVLEGNTLKVRVVRTGGDLTQPLVVNYKVKGGNVAGVDYKTLSGTVTIAAGATSAPIKVRAFDDGVMDGTKALKLRLVPSADGSYIIGAPLQAKIRIIDLETVLP